MRPSLGPISSALLKAWRQGVLYAFWTGTLRRRKLAGLKGLPRAAAGAPMPWPKPRLLAELLLPWEEVSPAPKRMAGEHRGPLAQKTHRANEKGEARLPADGSKREKSGEAAHTNLQIRWVFHLAHFKKWQDKHIDLKRTHTQILWVSFAPSWCVIFKYNDEGRMKISILAEVTPAKLKWMSFLSCQHHNYYAADYQQFYISSTKPGHCTYDSKNILHGWNKND